MLDDPRFTAFVATIEHSLLRHADDEAALTAAVAAGLRPLLDDPHWLPAPWRRPGADRYRQYPLHIDADGRFSVISFVWGPGQATPVHDHTVWGVIGVLQGVEQCDEYAQSAAGPLQPGCGHLLKVGEIDVVSPQVGDIHRVSNALPDAVSISIHVYGADIGRVRRHVYDPATGATTEFVSGYSPLS